MNCHPREVFVDTTEELVRTAHGHEAACTSCAPVRVMSTPREVQIAITTRCNLRCFYCYHFDSADDVAEDLPTGEWLRFFSELNQCAVLSVTLSGGEPFLRPDLKTLLDGLVRNRLRFRILSNGTLITDEDAEFLRSTRRCDHVQLSIDGPFAGPHDAMRGAGSFERAMRGLKTLQRHGIRVGVRVTIHQHNLYHLEEIARLLLEEHGLRSFSTNVAGYLGLCRRNAAKVQLNAEQRSWAMETLLRLERKYPGRILAQAGPLAEARMWTAMERARRNGLQWQSHGGYMVGCGGVFKTLAVRADGVIVACNQLPHVELGRINRDCLRTVWQTHPELQRLRRRRNIPLTEFEFCRGCQYLSYCTGNCPALAYAMLGNEDHPSPDACLKRFLEEGGRLPPEELWPA
ncbi:MAG: SynChlorMet cassette radical SAM/SPASM protein ScmE [Verrucomicrobiae bacterium]|nr:SynChlorMet cassette radical SAM/SPASM protein ScmE [Verrucomicrobiae bacterium]